MSNDVWRELDAWEMEHCGPLSSSASSEHADIIGRLVAQAVAAEREACAKIAVEWFEAEFDGTRSGVGLGTAIRARGTK